MRIGCSSGIVEIFEEGRLCVIIAIKEADIFAPCLSDAIPAAAPDTFVLLVDDDDAVRIAGLPFFQDIDAVVGRAIIDEDELIAVERLSHKRSNAFWQILLYLVAGDDDADFWASIRHGNHSSTSKMGIER